MSDWDAAKYHRISDPQLAWGRAVAARLAPADGERILDLGCGTGRLTEEIAQLPGIFVVGLDYSEAMLRQVRRQGPRTNGVLPVYVRGDGAALPFARAFDAVFSAAVFHWIPDHDQMFRSSRASGADCRTPRLPVETRPRFLSEITSQAASDNPPLTLDYWRLNIAARKSGA
jgi:trans-aconitate 2-methyltransferase